MLSSMLSIIIPTNESERLLVRTLSCLVPGATAGLVREVILSDAGSKDETAEVGDVAGCRLLPLPGPLGPRLEFAASSARSEWLLFVRPGCVLDAGWVADVSQFMDRAPERIAAVFTASARPRGQPSFWREFWDLRRARRASFDPNRGLLIARTFYRDVGGHKDGREPERGLLRRIGRKRISVLRTGITVTEN